MADTRARNTTRTLTYIRVIAAAAVCLVALGALAALCSCSAPAKSTVTITLNSQAGTGHLWTYVANPENGLEEVRHDAKALDNRAGGNVQDIYTFKAVKSGDVSLAFALERPWEKDTTSARLITYTFKIDDALNVSCSKVDSDGGDSVDPTIS